MKNNILVFPSKSKESSAEDLYYDTSTKKFYTHKRVEVCDSIVLAFSCASPVALLMILRRYDIRYLDFSSIPMQRIILVSVLLGIIAFSYYMRKDYFDRLEKIKGEFVEYSLDTCDIKQFIFEKKDAISDYLLGVYFVKFGFIVFLFLTLINRKVSDLIVCLLSLFSYLYGDCIYQHGGKREKLLLKELADKYEVFK